MMPVLGDDRHRRIHALMAKGDWPTALAVIDAMIEEDAGDARSHFLRGRIALERNEPGVARASFARAVEIDDGEAEFQAFLSYCHAMLGDDAAAVHHAEAAAALPASDRTLDLVATIRSRLGRHSDAACVLRRAADEGSRIPAIFFNLATELKFCGDFAGARSALERAIELDPAHVKSRVALSALRAASAEDNQIADYERLLDNTRDPEQRLHLCHAAARECDAIGQYDRAFAFLESGKAPLRAITGYDFLHDQALFDAMRRGFAGARPAAGHSDNRPIFVVGMPRSGTTVVDRILSGHPDVVSAGETLHFSALLQEMAERASPQLLDPGDVAPLLTRDDLSALGRAYMDRLVRGEGRRVIDKFHLNSLLAGFILRALPDAKMVCAVRGAMDTIVGNYRQLLDYRSEIYRYTLALDTIARFYVEFRRLAQFWETLFPARFMILSYEKLIAHPEAVSRELFAFLGLDWRPEYLKIENNPAPVATASAVQVREPLNARSVGRWRHYARQLDSSRAIIEQAGLSPEEPGFESADVIGNFR